MSRIILAAAAVAATVAFGYLGAALIETGTARTALTALGLIAAFGAAHSGATVARSRLTRTRATPLFDDSPST